MWPNVRTLNFLSSLLLFLQHLVIDMLCQSLGIPHLKESDCSSVYFDCTLTEGGTVWSVEEEECATGMYFDPLNLVCDYPQNIPGCEDFVTTTT